VSADRDRILEQALKHELRGNDPALRGFGKGEHLDAETLAAWQDDALNAAQMEAVELHVSTCERCQSMLAAFARGTSGTSGTIRTSGTLRTSGTFSFGRWWLAPIAAGATAVVLWMVAPEQQQIASAPPHPPAAEVAVDKVQPPPIVDRQKADAPAAAAEARARAADSAASENKLSAEAARDDRQRLKDQAQAAPKEESPVAQASPAPATGYTPVAPPSAPAPAARAEAGARVAELQKSAQPAFAPIEVPTLDRNIRWRFAGHRIERTSDGGATWTLMREGDESISAGSAPTASAAWFAGRNGVVLLTVNAGATFTIVGLAEPLDIASISATDGRQAVISTVSGRRFRTEDAGRTWLPF
jgi:hypothetical protein